MKYILKISVNITEVFWCIGTCLWTYGLKWEVRITKVNSFNCFICIVLSLHWLYSPLGPWSLIFSFMIILQTVGLLGWVISSSQGLYLNTGQHKHRINTYTYQTSMPCVWFEPTIPAFERPKAVHALDPSATVTGTVSSTYANNPKKDFHKLKHLTGTKRTQLKR
jgi:hypothetical protein